MFPSPTPQPYPEDHPLTITARYYEACCALMRGNGHKTEITDTYFQGRYIVECLNPGCYATLFIMIHDGTILHHGRGAEARCPLATFEENLGRPVGLAKLWQRERENRASFLAEIDRLIGRAVPRAEGTTVAPTTAAGEPPADRVAP